MREPPDDLDDDHVLDAVAAHWPGEVDRLVHLPVGFGAHHWRAERADAAVWFVTYDRFGARHTLSSLTAAYAGAAELAARGLEFVLAPAVGRRGQLVVPVAHGALSVTPWSPGPPVGEGSLADAVTAAQNMADLARLHTVAPPDGIPRWVPAAAMAMAARVTALAAQPWRTGPYGEPARAAVTAHLDELSGWVTRYGVAARAAEDRPWVATHGEAHTRNQLATPTGIRFVDWESLKLAPRERDLATLVQDGYGAEVGADPPMVELFDLEWRLSEIDAYAHWFAAPHAGTADDRIAYEGLLGELDRGPWWPA